MNPSKEPFCFHVSRTSHDRSEGGVNLLNKLRIDFLSFAVTWGEFHQDDEHCSAGIKLTVPREEIEHFLNAVTPYHTFTPTKA